MADGILGLINSAALVTGYVILGTFGTIILLGFLKPAISYGLWKDRSDGAKQIGAQMQKEHGYDSGASAWFADMIMEEIENAAPDSHMEYQPSPIATLDWSIDDPNSLQINLMKSALSDAGFYVHPFPQEREGEWSNQHVGIWQEEPEWFIEVTTEEDEMKEVTVTPNLNTESV